MAKRRRSCKRKRRHTTRAQAEEQLRSLERNRYTGGYMHVYKCWHCGCWHIGHRIGFGGRRK
jgi:hypothetical protein